MTVPPINQAVVGDHNIFTGAGDIKVVYELSSAESGDRRNLLVLLERVKQFWIKDVFEDSVRPVALLLLSKKTMPDAVEHPWKTALGTKEESQEIPPDKNISAVFDEMGRLLLILGEPGSGKTTTLLELTRDLIEAAMIDPTKPIPVVFHLSSWSEKRQPIFDWLVEELRTKYYIPPRLGRSFLTDNRLLPLLDGLDEVYPAYQSACVEAVNRFARDVGIPGLVVSCRFHEYRELSQRLNFNGAIYLQPLSFQQIDKHLEERGEGLASLRTVLREDAVLQHLAGSPLMVDVMVAAYHDLPIEALRDESLNTAKARREHIFQTYVARMFERRSQNSAPFFQEKIMFWTSLLAKNMTLHAQNIFLIERIQPSWLLSRRQLFAYLLSSRTAAGLVLGFPLVLPVLWGDQPPGERIGYSICILVLTFTMGTFAALLKLRQSKNRNESGVPHDVPSSWRVGLRVFTYIVVGGLLGAPIGGIGGWIWLTQNFDTLSSIPASIGLAQGWHHTLTSFPEATPSEHYGLFIFQLTLLGLVMGVCYGLVFGLIIGMRDKKRSLRDDIQTAETIGWSGVRAKKALKRVFLWVLLISALCGIIIFPVALLVLFYQVLTNQGTFTDFVRGVASTGIYSVFVLVALTLVLSIPFGTMGALLGGLTASTGAETAHLTNRGIRSSLKKSIYAGIITGSILALMDVIMNIVAYRFHRLIGSTFGTQQIIISKLLLNYPMWVLTYGMLAALWYGGLDIIKHYSLRLVLFLKGNGPRRFDTFLEYAVKLRFMYRIGGGYIFIHSLLRDYFEERLTTEKQT